MNMDELYNYYFKEEFQEEYNRKLDVIKQSLSGQDVTIKIVSDISDCYNKKNDPNFRKDELIQVQENKVSFIYDFENLFKNIKRYISKDVKQLALPTKLLDNINELDAFPNIETFTDTGYSRFTEEELDYFNGRGITNIKFSASNPISFGNIKTDDYTFMTSPTQKGYYKNLVMNRSEKTNRDYKTDRCLISAGKLNFDKILSLVDKDNYPQIIMVEDKEKSELEIKISSDKEIEKITMKKTSITKAMEILDYFNNNDFKINESIFQCENKDHQDIKLFEKVSEKDNLQIKYNLYDKCSYDDFINMRGTLKWFKQIITENNLSPLEKATFAYDIMKTFKYNESNEDKTNSRYIPNIIKGGNIVCVGYSVFLKQILNELEIPAENIGVTCKTPEGGVAGHQRNLVKIDDEKYHVHGVYAVDATWDSRKEGYNALDLYRYFLVPAREYQDVFKGDSIPDIFKAYLNNETPEREKDESINDVVFNIEKIMDNEKEEMYSKKYTTQSSINDLFGIKEYDDNVVKYLNCIRPPLETFNEVLRNVRQAEGYIVDTLEEEVNKTVEINRMLSDQNEMPFFEEKDKNVSI